MSGKLEASHVAATTRPSGGKELLDRSPIDNHVASLLQMDDQDILLTPCPANESTLLRSPFCHRDPMPAERTTTPPLMCQRNVPLKPPGKS